MARLRWYEEVAGFAAAGNSSQRFLPMRSPLTLRSSWARRLRKVKVQSRARLTMPSVVASKTCWSWRAVASRRASAFFRAVMSLEKMMMPSSKGRTKTLNQTLSGAG